MGGSAYLDSESQSDNLGKGEEATPVPEKPALNPREIETMIPGAKYKVPTFRVGDDGLEQAGEQIIEFCKGDKSDPSKLRQTGFFTETIIAVAKEYLEDVNQGDLASEDTVQVIAKLDEALALIDKRAQERKARGVQGTYQK